MPLFDLYATQKYDVILDKYLKDVMNVKIARTNRRFEERFSELMYTLFSSYMLGCYSDCIKLYQKAISIIPLVDDYWSPVKLVQLAEIRLISMCFCLFNANEFEYSIDIISELDSLVDEIPILLKNANMNNDLIAKHCVLYDQYKKGNHPYYIVKYLYPYEPMFDTYTFNLQTCPPYVSLTVKRVPREHDCFTSFEFKVYGYTKADTFWKGHCWENQDRFPAVKKTLPLLNLYLLRIAGATPGRFLPLFSIEQVSSVELSLFAGNNEMIHYCNGTDFTGQWVGRNVPERILTNEELQYLNDLIISNYGCRHFVMQYHQAKNNISAGLYVESFLLFCTSLESMLYYWCEQIATKYGKCDEYQKFSKTKISSCDVCDLCKESNIDKKPNKGTEPNVAEHINYLVINCGVKKESANKINDFIRKARGYSLRNDIVHGRVNEVSLSQLTKTEQAIMSIQEAFLDIEKELQVQ